MSVASTSNVEENSEEEIEVLKPRSCCSMLGAREMSRTQINYVEVVLLSWQKLPDELFSLSANWIFIESRFYRIAQADIYGALTVEVLGLFEQLKKQNYITDFCSRVVVRTSDATTQPIDRVQANYSALPDWIRP